MRVPSTGEAEITKTEITCTTQLLCKPNTAQIAESCVTMPTVLRFLAMKVGTRGPIVRFCVSMHRNIAKHWLVLPNIRIGPDGGQGALVVCDSPAPKESTITKVSSCLWSLSPAPHPLGLRATLS